MIKSLLRLIGRPTALQEEERGKEKREGEHGEEGYLLFRMLLREIAESERERERETVEGNCPEGNGVVQCPTGAETREGFSVSGDTLRRSSRC